MALDHAKRGLFFSATSRNPLWRHHVCCVDPNSSSDLPAPPASASLPQSLLRRPSLLLLPLLSATRTANEKQKHRPAKLRVAAKTATGRRRGLHSGDGTGFERFGGVGQSEVVCGAT